MLCFGSVNQTLAAVMSHVRSITTTSVGEAEGYLSEAAVGVLICWAAIRAVAAARLLLFV